MNRLRALALFAALAACDDDGGSTTEPPTLAERPDLQVCTTGWQVVFAPEQDLGMIPMGPLYLVADRLYFNQEQFSQMGVWAVPAQGGAAVRLHGDALWAFWPEDDGLMFARSDGIYRLPLAGGAPERVLTTKIAEQGRFPLAQAMDRDGFYFAEDHYLGGFKSEFTIKKLPRAGGPIVDLGALGNLDSSGIRHLYALGDHVLAVPYGEGHAFVVPNQGGPIVAIPPPPGVPRLVGVSGTGVLWNSSAGGFDGTKGSDRYALTQSRLDGSPPEPFWPGKPPTLFTLAAWADGAGGWYLAAWEWATDEALHLTIWRVDRGGHGSRLACDPEVMSTVETAAVGPGVVYPMVRYSNHTYWSIVGVAGLVE